MTLVNQLARVHRELRFALSAPSAPLVIPTSCGGNTVGDEIHRLTKRIDPFGTFEFDRLHWSQVQSPSESAPIVNLA